uniref:Uncharacterized protein n=1 Tax=uncultured organism MedDCM-OCT-S01-C25 TaxID=743600 RepID=D6PIZ8_9ZZZZ|nr:hypothetical protein [uncultured organism MedDCM-OCT-S01-C25]
MCSKVLLSSYNQLTLSWQATPCLTCWEQQRLLYSPNIPKLEALQQMLLQLNEPFGSLASWNVWLSHWVAA